MNKLLKILLVGLSVLAIIFLACSDYSPSSAQVRHFLTAQKPSGWKTVVMPQEDGRHLSISLPYNLEKHQPIRVIRDPKIKSGESYYHEGMEYGLFVIAYHGVLTDPNNKIDFNMNTFMSSFNKSEKFHSEVRTLEKRNINGQDVTYADIKYGIDGENRRLEGIGINLDNEFWTILFCYHENNGKAIEKVKMSIASILID